jgi:uncharacterized Zn finger protein (UPF0148 family)
MNPFGLWPWAFGLWPLIKEHRNSRLKYQALSPKLKRSKSKDLPITMSTPDIARRCPACGASIRERAFFCPQCGRDLNLQKSTAEKESETAVTKELRSVDSRAETQPQQKPDIKAPANELQRDTALRVRETVRSLSAAAPAAVEAGRQQVQKIREISTVVLDEASYDPSVRFVLVVLALFMLFLLLLFLSKWIG